MNEVKSKLESLEMKVDRLHERIDELSSSMRTVLYGNGKDFGLIGRMNVLWTNHVWVACAASTAGGCIGTLLFVYLWGGF